MFYLQDIMACPGPQSALLELNSQVKEKFSKLRHRIQVRPHIAYIAPDRFLAENLKSFISCGVLLLSGSGADGQRAGQWNGQTGHPGRDGEPAEADAEVCGQKLLFVSNHLWSLTLSVQIQSSVFKLVNLLHFNPSLPLPSEFLFHPEKESVQYVCVWS